MLNGWHKITDSKGYTRIRWVQNNIAVGEAVYHLLKQNCLIEPVLVLTQGELDNVINAHLPKQDRIRV